MRDIRFETIRIIENGSLLYNVSSGYLAVKRLFDIIGAFLLLLFFAPLLVIVFVLIRIIYGETALIHEERIGFRGNVFKMFKFRSSSADCGRWLKSLQHSDNTSDGCRDGNCDEGPSFAGKLIVKTGIEKLPALFNVIKGDLSLVGPCPSAFLEALNYKPKHILRFSAKPGITGLWRISKANCSEVEEMVKMDLKYIRERNFKYDLLIMLKTISVLFGVRRLA